MGVFAGGSFASVFKRRAGARNKCSAFYCRLDPLFDLRILGHGIDHHQRVTVDLETVRGRWIAVGQVLIDQERRKRVVAMESVAEAAAAFV